MRNIIIYHRASTIHSDKQIGDVIAKLKTLLPHDERFERFDIEWERADDVLDQAKLERIVAAIKHGAKVDEIIAYSLNTLVNTHYVGAMEYLKNIIIDLKTNVRFYKVTPIEVLASVYIFDKFKENRLLERNQLSTFRMKENGTTVGRRPKIIDVDKAITLRGEGKSYEQIAESLECSAMHVYRNMPVSMRGCLTDKTKRRMQKLQERIDAKRKDLRDEDIEKINPEDVITD